MSNSQRRSKVYPRFDFLKAALTLAADGVTYQRANAWLLVNYPDLIKDQVRTVVDAVFERPMPVRNWITSRTWTTKISRHALYISRKEWRELPEGVRALNPSPTVRVVLSTPPVTPFNPAWFDADKKPEDAHKSP